MKECTYYCDKCGVEIDNRQKLTDFEETLLVDGFHMPDLCMDCLSELKEWWP